jgi:hypothetical protein
MLGAGIFAIADPVGVREFTGESDSTADLGGMTAKTNEAQAGNVTALVANTTLVTKTWQGYYGNVTGKIVLGNANNKSPFMEEITSERLIFVIENFSRNFLGFNTPAFRLKFLIPKTRD